MPFSSLERFANAERTLENPVMRKKAPKGVQVPAFNGVRTTSVCYIRAGYRVRS